MPVYSVLTAQLGHVHFRLGGSIFDRYGNCSSRLVAVDQAGRVYRFHQIVRYKDTPILGTSEPKRSMSYSIGLLHYDREHKAVGTPAAMRLSHLSCEEAVARGQCRTMMCLHGFDDL